MRIEIADTKCQGHARCWSLAPGLFSINEDGLAEVADDGTVDEGQAEKARLAVANCPENAIRLRQ